MKSIFKVLFIVLGLYCFKSDKVFAQGQSVSEIAQQYISTGEWDKAVVYLEKQYDTDPYGVYPSYLQCLLQLKDYEKAEKLIKKHFKKNIKNLPVLIDLGKLYETQNQPDKAKGQYDKAVKMLDPDLQQVLNLANTFIMNSDYDYALQTYLAGRKLMKGTYPFNFELAEMYAQLGDNQKMMEEYLGVLELGASYYQNLQTILQNKIAFDTDGKITDMVRVALLRKIQKDPENTLYSEMLYWLFLQEKDFESALVQARSMDKKGNEDGRRLLALGDICVVNQQYKTAEECFQYVLNKGKENSLYNDARMDLINCVSTRITSSNSYTQEDLKKLETDYEAALSELGKNVATAPLIRGYAHLEGFYAGNIDKASSLLRETIEMPGIKPEFQAECKLELGDILLLKGEVWDATLYYSQVDKDFKHDAIGRDAKFRNAKLSYYIGEFDWAVAQLDILKSSTSQLIANDAMSLSLLISDNTGDENNNEPMLIYSRADLLAYQHKYEQALATLDSILTLYPGHSLTDEVWFKKAGIYEEKRDFTKAITFLQEIIDKYPDDILADDALFDLADLNENQLNNKDKAKELYENLITKYPGSLYVVEARKRFRALRGDKVN